MKSPEPADPGEPAGAVPIVLFVCSAHRVRSPFADAAARQLIVEHGLRIGVRSAGFGESGLPAVDDMAEVAEKWDLDLSEHLSRRVDRALIEGSDLILTMEGEHVVDVVGLDSSAVHRALTLREAAARVEESGAPDWTPGSVRAWARSATDRPMATLLEGDVDVADPIGRSRRVYRRAASEIRALLETVFAP